MKYAIEQRLRFIDFLLYSYGYVNRSMIIDYFAVSMPQASRDIGEYLKLAPNNVEYSTKDKAYKATQRFKRYWE